ncbi:MAG: autotransporter assembly complex family protein [Woeseiaceae bacterium]|nr:autotransporter assembly complex family protein [Woeseiaceae bacterium]
MFLFRFSFLLLALAMPGRLLAELVVSGVQPEIEQNVRAYVSLASEPCDAEPWRIRRRFRTIETETRRALEPFGYYRPEIAASLAQEEQCWQATLSIDPGSPVVLRNVEILIDGAAASDAAFAGMKNPQALAPGTALRHANYDALKRNLQIVAADRGYIEADFLDSRLDVWPEQGVADILVHFDSGPRYRIGEIRVEQAFIDPALVTGYLDLQPGDYFDSNEIARAYRDLSDSAYFGSIAVVPVMDAAANQEIPLRVSLKPGTRIEYTIGVGASTDTGARLRTGFRNNRINQRGHRLIADLGVSPVVQGLTVEYRIPLGDPRREWFSITGALSNEDVDSFDNEAQRLGVRWTKAMSDTWLRTLGLDFINESFNIGTDVDTSRMVVPSIAFDHKKADRDIFPRRGRRFGVELRGTDQTLGSTTSYLQLLARLRLIRPLGADNRIIARLNAGTTASSDFNELPPTVRFFAGGDESIRGFGYESLGPRDAAGHVIGGTNLLVGSIEYEHHLRGDFYGAVFVDAGNAFDDIDFNVEVGTGIGVKWRSPLGPIRVYLGYPLTKDDPGIRLHLRLGADL